MTDTEWRYVNVNAGWYYNSIIRTAGIFDGVIDFNAVTLDPATGELKAAFQPNSSVGGPGGQIAS